MGLESYHYKNTTDTGKAMSKFQFIYPFSESINNGLNLNNEFSTELAESLKAIYLRMFDEINSDYAFKYDVLRNLVFEIIHLALKTQTVTASLYSKSNATIRVSSLFLELLERQFPIESITQQVNFRSPSEYASICRLIGVTL